MHPTPTPTPGINTVLNTPDLSKVVAEGLWTGIWLAIKSGGWAVILMLVAFTALRIWLDRTNREKRIRERVRIEEDERRRLQGESEARDAHRTRR